MTTRVAIQQRPIFSLVRVNLFILYYSSARTFQVPHMSKQKFSMSHKVNFIPFYIWGMSSSISARFLRWRIVYSLQWSNNSLNSDVGFIPSKFYTYHIPIRRQTMTYHHKNSSLGFSNISVNCYVVSVEY